jgi:phosphotransferase system  glucose/maltose/N-acetylglucosamine-specific IIC component
MTTILGLPAHALLVHAIVVLAPLTAALQILCALWPAARRRLVWLVLAFAIAVMVLTPLTVSAGQWLYAQSSQHTPILETHEDRGEWMTYFAVGLLVVAIVGAVQHWLESRSPEPRRVLAGCVAVLAVVVGVSTMVAVVRIGDSGAQAVWGERE